MTFPQQNLVTADYPGGRQAFYPTDEVIFCTWTTKPAASAVRLGTKLCLTDFNYIQFFSDGTYWKPINGSVRLYYNQVTGDPSNTQLHQLTGNSTDQAFTLPTDCLIPSGMLIPNISRLLVEFMTRRGGAAGAAANVRAYIGNTANAVGNIFAVQSMPLTDGAYLHTCGQVLIQSGATVGGRNLPNSAGSVTGPQRLTTNGASSLPNVDMYVNFGIQSTWTADTCNLLMYSVTLEG